MYIYKHVHLYIHISSIYYTWSTYIYDMHIYIYIYIYIYDIIELNGLHAVDFWAFSRPDLWDSKGTQEGFAEVFQRDSCGGTLGDSWGLPVELVACGSVACRSGYLCIVACIIADTASCIYVYIVYEYICAYVHGLVACGSLAYGQVAWNPRDSYGILEESHRILQTI